MRFRCMIVRKFGQERKNDHVPVSARSIREKRTKPQRKDSLHRLPNFPCAARNVCALSRVSNINHISSAKSVSVIITAGYRPLRRCILQGKTNIFITFNISSHCMAQGDHRQEWRQCVVLQHAREDGKKSISPPGDAGWATRSLVNQQR